MVEVDIQAHRDWTLAAVSDGTRAPDREGERVLRWSQQARSAPMTVLAVDRLRWREESAPRCATPT